MKERMSLTETVACEDGKVSVDGSGIANDMVRVWVQALRVLGCKQKAL
jgi:hypothetical protein